MDDAIDQLQMGIPQHKCIAECQTKAKRTLFIVS